MRTLVPWKLTAGWCVLVSAALVAQQPASQPRAADAPAALTLSQIEKPSTASWPTYNGDYSGRRFSTLAKINASQRASTSASRGCTICRPPAPSRRRRCRSTASSTSRRPTTRTPSRRGPAGALALHLDAQPRRHPHRQSRRRRARRTRLLRHPRLQSRRRSTSRPAQENWFKEYLLDRDDVLRVGRAGGGQGQADRRRQRRRPRRAGLPRRAQPRERRADLAVVRDAAEGRRPRPRHLAQPRHGASTAAA